MKAALLVLAAGLGSRFGGDKQISNVGPHGEILMEYSIHDAIEAGFTKVVFVLKKEMVDVVKSTVGEKFKDRAELCYCVQDYSTVPSFYKIPADRVKPFGTVHAVLAAKDALTEPFVTVNADDYYGKECFKLMYKTLSELSGGSEAAMVAYKLGNTLSLNGAVTRGVCTVEGGKLKKVLETGGINPTEDGKIVGEFGELSADLPVSMNFWGFHNETLENMQKYFEDFLKNVKDGDIKAECLLPSMVDEFINAGSVEVLVDVSGDKWFGITYKDDKPDVEAKLKALHAAGVYPEEL